MVGWLVRRLFSKSDAERNRGLVSPEDVIRFDDISYGDDARWNILDVYRPRKAEGKALPVIVSVHGGGWMYGDKEAYQFYGMNLAQRGFAVVNFSYRLAPEHKFPASIEDTNAVFTWVLNNAERYGFDLNNVFAVGDSVGAQMLCLFTAICTNPDYAKRYDFTPPQGFVPKALALNCGCYYASFRNRYDNLTCFLMFDLFAEHGRKEELEMINVAPLVTMDFPPVFLMTAVNDFLIKHSTSFAHRLEELGIPHIYRCYGDDSNRLSHVFH